MIHLGVACRTWSLLGLSDHASLSRQSRTGNEGLLHCPNASTAHITRQPHAQKQRGRKKSGSLARHNAPTMDPIPSVTRLIGPRTRLRPHPSSRSESLKIMSSGFVDTRLAISCPHFTSRICSGLESISRALPNNRKQWMHHASTRRKTVG